jgi:hypothetical protein
MGSKLVSDIDAYTFDEQQAMALMASLTAIKDAMEQAPVVDMEGDAKISKQSICSFVIHFKKLRAEYVSVAQCGKVLQLKGASKVTIDELHVAITSVLDNATGQIGEFYACRFHIAMEDLFRLTCRALKQDAGTESLHEQLGSVLLLADDALASALAYFCFKI